MGRVATAPARPAPSPQRRRAPRRHVHAPRRVSPAPLPRGAAVLDALLHGRAWIALVFVLLAGIVFFNVDLLRMNREIAVTAERAKAVKLENARLRTDIARLGSSERIQRVAAERGLVLPAPGEVRYLRSRPTVDGRRAAARIRSDATQAQAAPAPAPAAQAPAPTAQAAPSPAPAARIAPDAPPAGQAVPVAAPTGQAGQPPQG